LLRALRISFKKLPAEIKRIPDTGLAALACLLRLRLCLARGPQCHQHAGSSNCLPQKIAPALRVCQIILIPHGRLQVSCPSAPPQVPGHARTDINNPSRLLTAPLVEAGASVTVSVRQKKTFHATSWPVDDVQFTVSRCSPVAIFFIRRIVFGDLEAVAVVS
jgi:hypothetical protein